ncbi:hypothetical protein GCK32_000325 [Trichostrongylus colubriformis]|uniref:Uncharacterized protein n=1 Tax=Trichostrongylus colubriformis TaxID=6319 RepID=A0AAN8EUY4_TRICO
MQFLPMHPNEGIVPLRVWKLNSVKRACLVDRADQFVKYNLQHEDATVRMSKVFNMAGALGSRLDRSAPGGIVRSRVKHPGSYKGGERRGSDRAASLADYH